MRRRLLLPSPSLPDAPPPYDPNNPPSCKHHAHFQHAPQCPKHHDQQGIHEELCAVGGGIVRRHNAIRTWLARKVRDLTQDKVAEEQMVPRLDIIHMPTTKHPNGRRETANIDIITQDDIETTMYDVVVANIACNDSMELLRRTTEPGRAGRIAAIRKRNRYGGEVLPFAVEDTGRLHPQAARVLHQLAENTHQPQLEYSLLVAELQTVLFSTSLSSQRASHGIRAT